MILLHGKEPSYLKQYFLMVAHGPSVIFRAHSQDVTVTVGNPLDRSRLYCHPPSLSCNPECKAPAGSHMN